MSLIEILKLTQRSGNRKPIINIDETQDKKDDVKNDVREVEDLDEEEKKQIEEAEMQKKKKKESNEIVKLKPLNNIKHLIENFNSSLMKDKEKLQMSKKNEKRKQKVIRITTGLLLGYNYIRSLDEIYDVVDKVISDGADNLQWLDLQHNYLTTISEDLTKLTNIKMLYLHCNYIFDLKELVKLKSLVNLTAITIHGNPVVRIPNFRLHLIQLFPKLKKIDTVLVTKEERSSANVWVNIFNLKVLPAYTNVDCPKPPETTNHEKETDEY